MTDLRQAAQQALEALCSAVEPKKGKVYARGFEPIDCYAMHEQAITALREALEQPEQEPTCPKCKAAVLYECVACSNNNYPPRPEQEPCIGKDPRCPCQDGDACHYKDCGNTKALPAAQPEQEPDRRALQAAGTHPAPCARHCEAKAFEIEIRWLKSMLYTTPPAAQPEQEPWRESASDYERGVIDGRQMQAQSSVDKAVNAMTQRPWQGLTGEEVQFYIKKHSKLVNAGYDKVTDTNLVAKTFDSTGFYKEVSTVLKERNT